MSTSLHAGSVCEKVCAAHRYPINDQSQGFVYQMTQFQEKRIRVAVFALRDADGSVNKSIFSRDGVGCATTLCPDERTLYRRPPELTVEHQTPQALARHTIQRKAAFADMTGHRSMCKLKPTREKIATCAECRRGIRDRDEPAVAQRCGETQPVWTGSDADAMVPVSSSDTWVRRRK